MKVALPRHAARPSGADRQAVEVCKVCRFPGFFAVCVPS